MPRAPLAANEAARLESLRALSILDTAPEEAFDALVRAASRVCGVPVCLISLVDADRQWFKANIGLHGISQTPRDQSFCAHAILREALFEVSDASQDARFFDNPLVTSSPHIRFYAGAPLRLRGGECVGTLCVIDWQPRVLDARQRDILAELAVAASHALEGRRALAAERRLLESRAEADTLLRQSEARFRALSDASPLGVFALDAQGRCTYANAQWQAMLGLTPAQALGPGWMDALVAPDRQAVREALQRTAATGEQLDQALRVLHPDGSVRHVHVTACPVAGPGHAAGSLVGAVRDTTAQKAQEQALRESQALLDHTGRLAGVGGWSLDLASGALAWSDETCRIHGLAPGHRPTLQEAIGFYAPEARPVVQAAVAHGMDSGQGWDLELALVQAGGRRVWIRSVGSVECAGGRPVRLIGAIQDVTDSRAQRQAMVQAKERMEAATQSGEIGIWDYDRATGALTWDAQMRRFYGLAPGQPVHLGTWREHLHPDDRAATEQAFEDALAGLRPYAVRFRIVWGDGTVRHLRATGQVTRDAAGRAVRMVGVNWDVSQVRELALELERKEQMLRSVADSLPMLVNYIDAQQRYRFANQTYAAWHGKPVHEIVGRPVADVVGPETWAKVAPHLRAALQGAASVHEHQLCLGGRQRDLRVQFMPQRDARGRVEGVVTVISDISEYKAIQQRLAQTVEQAVERLRQTNVALVQRNLDLQQFAFVASHDLRSPLRSVKSYLTLLQARHAGNLDAKALDLIARARRALEQMDCLTQGLLAYARLDAPALALEAVDCNELLAHVLGLMEAGLAESGAQVTAPAPLPTVTAERAQLVQLLQNLLGNALKYCQGRAPRVQVSARREAGAWLFEVADNGIGIEPQHQGRIFEIFKRLHTAEEYPGTGIGLAICERIVARHGGRIGVTSEPGRGSTFFFSIPDLFQVP